MPPRAVACTPPEYSHFCLHFRAQTSLMTKSGVSEVEKLVPTARKHGRGQGWERRLKSPAAA